MSALQASTFNETKNKQGFIQRRGGWAGKIGGKRYPLGESSALFEDWSLYSYTNKAAKWEKGVVATNN